MRQRRLQIQWTKLFVEVCVCAWLVLLALLIIHDVHITLHQNAVLPSPTAPQEPRSRPRVPVPPPPSRHARPPHHRVAPRKLSPKPSEMRIKCSSIPPIARQFSATTLTEVMHSRGYSPYQISQVLACLHKE